ncbi:hypothetical protein ACHAWU_003057 [Discostella pseudostelligera]|uniref:Uncharacterized protein n=1 Tax=Discostella pseudostelligera TaxID=259834 RepID=A0ABD3M4P2_9STRA
MAAPSKTGVPKGGGRDTTTQVAIAAEELIKAACTHVDSTSLTLGKETVEGLKEVSAGLAALKLSNDTKLNTLNQSISNLKEEVVKHNSAVINAISIQSKDQKLQWAISNVGINAFEYFDKKDSSGGYSSKKSTKLAQEVLLAFRKGDSWYIDNLSMTWYTDRYDHSVDAKVIEDGEKQFREKFSNQIHELIGQKPRVALTDNRYAIFYS